MLITFEGIDGAGKSTQVKKLRKALTESGREVLTLREPGGTDVAEKIREILLESKNEITPIGELLLFSASRAELVQQVISPALAGKKVVIVDRFYDSTTAYQGYGRGLDRQMLQKINDIATFGLKPDYTFFLDLSPEDALIRKFSEKSIPLAFEESELDRMERSGLDFYRRVRNGYLELAQREKTRFVMLDASEPPERIHKKIWSRLMSAGTGEPVPESRTHR